MPPRLSRLLACLGLLALAIGCGQPAAEDRPAPAVQTYDAHGRLLVDVVRPPHPPNLIVVVLDAVRADALPREGGAGAGAGDVLPPMPFLSSLAAKGIRFTNAVAAAPWTLPSMTSMVTGLLPSEHGQLEVKEAWHLPGAVTTFAEALSAGYGYETAALVNGEWYQQNGDSLLQGFSHQQPVFALQGTGAALTEWDRHRDPERPFFLLLHTFEAHDPYGARNHPWPPQRISSLGSSRPLRPENVDPAKIFRSAFLSTVSAQSLHARMGPALSDVLQRYKWRGYAENPDPQLAADLRDAYWEGVRWVDGLLARTHATLEARGLLENTLLVVASDHGEAFGEHDSLAHGLRLYDELIRVPLVMLGPDLFEGGDVVTESVGLVDVLPTFFDWAGLEPLAGVAGRSAVDVIRGADWCRPVVSEERLDRVTTGEDVNAVRVSVRTTDWKYIATADFRSGDVHEEAYDLVVDPEENHDLAGGTGVLPEDLAFDACLCEAIEAARARIWEGHEEDEETVHAMPDAASSPHVHRPRPTPCNAGA